MPGVKAQTTGEQVRARPGRPAAWRIGEQREMESERQRLRDILSEAPAPEPAPSAPLQSMESAYVRPMAESVSALREEGRAEVAREGPAGEALLSRLITLLVVGNTVVWYGPDGHRVDTFVLRPEAIRWGAGWYLATESELLRLVELDGQRGWEPWAFEDEDVGFLAHWLRPDDSRRFVERLGGEGHGVALVGIPSATSLEHAELRHGGGGAARRRGARAARADDGRGGRER
ncbi:hypothetical protein ACLESO_47295 [Pyxidicoccus sp. 3LG]